MTSLQFLVGNMNVRAFRRRGKDLDDFMRGRIYSLHYDAHLGYKRISQLTNIPKSTIAQYCRRCNVTGQRIKNRKNCKRPKKSSIMEDERIVNLSQMDPFRSAVSIKRETEDVCPLSVETVRRRLRAAKLFARKPAKKQMLSNNNINVRLRWALRYEDWTYENNWINVIYADESSFNLLNSGNTQYVRRPPKCRYKAKYIIKYENRSKASVNVWAVFGTRGFSPLVIIQGRMNAINYTQLLENNLLPIYNTLLPDGGYFVHDNCPIHTAAHTRN